MNKNTMIKTFFTLALFFAFTTGFAQDPVDPDPTLDNPGAPLNPAPIGDYLVPMFILGIATAYVLLRKKEISQVS